MRVLGLDLSLTATGAAIIEDGRIVATALLKPPAKMRDAERLDWLERALIDFRFRKGLSVELAAIEGYSFGAKNQREALGEWGGVVRLQLYRGNVPYIVIPPTTWRKTLTGKGNLAKDLVGLTLQRKYAAQLDGYDFATLDVLEAWAVAYAAWLPHADVNRKAQ